MILRSGNYVGVFVTADGRSVQLNLNLEVSGNGSFVGQFWIYPSYPGNNLRHWHGPTSGEIHRGGYSTFGTLHFTEAEDPDRFGTATFDGIFSAPEERICLLWGTALITKGDSQERGVLSAAYAEAPVATNGGGVWGE